MTSCFRGRLSRDCKDNNHQAKQAIRYIREADTIIESLTYRSYLESSRLTRYQSHKNILKKVLLKLKSSISSRFIFIYGMNIQLWLADNEYDIFIV